MSPVPPDGDANGRRWMGKARMEAFSDSYARREHLYTGDGVDEELLTERTTVLPATVGYLLAMGVGLVLPRLAVAVYFGVAVYLVVPLREIARLLFRRA